MRPCLIPFLARAFCPFGTGCRQPLSWLTDVRCSLNDNAPRKSSCRRDRQRGGHGCREVHTHGAVLEALRVRCRLSATPRLRPLERRHDPRGLLWVLFGSSACPVCSLSATSSLFSTGKRDARWTVYVYALVRTGPRSRRGCNKRASVNDAFAVLPGGVNPCRVRPAVRGGPCMVATSAAGSCGTRR